VVGDRFIGQAESTRLFGDALVYTQMAEGDYSDVTSPFRYRILVPSFAWILPFTATESLKIVSYTGLFVFYVVTLFVCKRLGFSLLASIGGLCVVFSTVWHLNNYNNPYLTDAAAIGLLALMLLSAIWRSIIAFIVTSAMAVLTREITLLLIPIWLVTKQWRRAGAAIVVGVLVLMLPRLLMSSDSGFIDSVTNNFNRVDRVGDLTSLAKPVLLHWGFVGCLTIFGLVLTPGHRFPMIVLAFALLSFAAVSSSFLATDVGRMIAILSPVMAVSCAQLIMMLLDSSRFISALLFAVIVTEIFWVPTIITSREGWVFDSVFPRAALGALEVILILAIVVILRTDLTREFGAKMTPAQGRMNNWRDS